MNAHYTLNQRGSMYLPVRFDAAYHTRLAEAERSPLFLPELAKRGSLWPYAPYAGRWSEVRAVPVANDSPRGLSEQFDDFYSDQIGAAAGNGLMWAQSSDAGDTAFDVVALSNMTARGTTAATNNNLIELNGLYLCHRGQSGVVGIEARVALDVVTNIAFNIGMNDDSLEDSNTLPVELSTTVFTTNSSTFYGFVFDVDATNDDLHAMWVDDDGDSTEAIGDLRFTGVAPTAAQWGTYRVVASDRGTGTSLRVEFTFISDAGVMTQKVFNTNVDRDALQVPYIGFENRSATAHRADVDYIHCWSNRDVF